jgi:FKBP-type peptidyl-prolyl cis-trans isomerase SlyD
MKIEKDSAVTARFKVSDLTGKLLDEGKQPIAYLHGGYGNVPPKIEEALEGQTAGYQVTLDLQPQDAFGERDENLVQTISRSQFPPGVKVGGQLQGRDREGHVRAFLVKKIKGQEVFLDGNHPLAGIGLRFAVTVVDVRAASEEEVKHGHVHGDGGHHH